MDHRTDEQLMARALRLALRGQGRVEPNPMVGCVIARAGRVLAQGWHRRFGGPHAEIEALADARRRGVDVAGADVFVTLEPCAHFGKTPPCADALIAARPRRVVAALRDPFPPVAGRGFRRLRQAGIQVEVGLGRDQARALNAPYLKRLATGLPWVIAKWAQTVDGRIATATGDSRWISGPASRRTVHELRARVDAVIVGIGTVLADDPLLTARDVPLRRTARRVVIDPELRLPADCALVRSAPAVPLLVAVSQAALQAGGPKLESLRRAGVALVALPRRSPRSAELSLRALLAHLAREHGAGNVLVEGGSGALGAFFGQDLVDQALVYVAPKLLGDPRGFPAVRGPDVRRMAQARRLKLESVRRLDDDLLLDYRCKPG